MAKLAPTERLLNIVKAIAIIVPLFGVGVFAGNTETIHNLFRSEEVKQPADQILKPTDKVLTPEEQQTLAINRLIDEQEKIKLDIQKLKARSSNSDGSLQHQINKWHGNE
jgi:hypothetical protein